MVIIEYGYYTKSTYLKTRVLEQNFGSRVYQT